jgi:hypothetical protein
MYSKAMFGDNSSSSSSSSSSSDGNEIKLNGHAWGILALLLVASLVLSAGWLALFKRFARQLIWTCLLLSPALCFVLAAVFFIWLHQAIAGVFLVVAGLLNLLFVYFVRSRIEFSANILTIVVQVLQLYPATTLVAFFGVFVQAFWIAVWIIAAAGTVHSIRNQDTVNPDGTQNNHDGGMGIAWVRKTTKTA